MKSMGNYDETLYLRLLTLPLQFFFVALCVWYLTFIGNNNDGDDDDAAADEQQHTPQHTPFLFYLTKYFSFRCHHL